MNFNYNFLWRAHLFCYFSEGSSFCLAQLLHHLVKQAVFILQQNIWLIIFFQSSCIQNLLISRRKPISTQCSAVTYYNSDNILERGGRGRIERLYLGGSPGWCLNGLITLFYWADKGLTRPFIIIMLQERKKTKVLDYVYEHSAVLWYFVFCQGHSALL